MWGKYPENVGQSGIFAQRHAILIAKLQIFIVFGFALVLEMLILVLFCQNTNMCIIKNPCINTFYIKN